MRERARKLSDNSAENIKPTKGRVEEFDIKYLGRTPV